MPAELRPALYHALSDDGVGAPAIGSDGCAMLRSELTACFGSEGARLHVKSSAPLNLRLSSWGREHDLKAARYTKPVLTGARAEYTHRELVEWWKVLPIGFEHGFTISRRPQGDGKLTLILATNRAARNENDGLSWNALRYDGLSVIDADGKHIPASIKADGNRVLIEADDASARYPLVVDPLVWLQQKVFAADGAWHDYLGSAFAMSGDVALAGAPYAAGSAGSNQGAVYVFSRSGGVWTQTQKLVASDGVAKGYFGQGIALDGNTAIIGAEGVAVNGVANAGAAYVFSRASDGTWSQTQKLTASTPYQQSAFGGALSIEGDTALVGAFYSPVGTSTYQGRAYVFKRDNTGLWSETQRLVAADGADNLFFGTFVLLHDGVAYVSVNGAIVNGNSHQGAVYVFSAANGIFTQTQSSLQVTAQHPMYSASRLPHRVRICSWARRTRSSTASAALVLLTFLPMSAASGSRRKSSLRPTAPPTPISATRSPCSDTALVAAPYATVGSNANQGAVYVLTESTDGSWNQTDKLIASDGALNNYFGWNLSFDGQTAGISAIGATINNSLQGAAYFLERSGGDPHTVTPVIATGIGTTTPSGRKASLTGRRPASPSHPIRRIASTRSAARARAHSPTMSTPSCPQRRIARSRFISAPSSKQSPPACPAATERFHPARRKRLTTAARYRSH
jgi:hypothetical protein